MVVWCPRTGQRAAAHLTRPDGSRHQPLVCEATRDIVFLAQLDSAGQKARDIIAAGISREAKGSVAGYRYAPNRPVPIEHVAELKAELVRTWTELPLRS